MNVGFGVVPVVPLGQVAAASLTTTWRGALRVTVVVKVTLGFSPGAEMPVIAPEEIVRVDTHMGDVPTRSLKASSDLVPHLPMAEVLFRGHACSKSAVSRLAVRLALAGERGTLLDKRLGVYGDRARPEDEPAPFSKMRIGYERTVGGADHPLNPIGAGFTGGQPNIFYLDPARAAEPVGLGPLAASWPCRRALLHGRERFAFESGPVALPDDVDWSHFQAAPADQRLAELPEKAWILLEGLHPEIPSLTMRIPDLRAEARLYGQAPATLSLRADTLFVDGEAQRCTLVFRGSFPVAGVSALKGAVIAAGVHAQGQSLAWPTEDQLPRSTGPAPLALKETAIAEPAAGGVVPLPFNAVAEPPPSRAPTLSPDEQWSSLRTARPAVKPVATAGTMVFSIPAMPEAPPEVPPPPLVSPPALVSAPPPVTTPPIELPPSPPPAPAPLPPVAAPPPAAAAAPPAKRPAPPPRPEPPPPPAASTLPIAPIPKVPVPAAASRRAYGKFGQNR